MDAGGRDGEDDMFDIIRGEDDGSQFLNNSGVGLEIERTNEGQISNDGEENVGAITSLARYIKPLVITRCIN